MNTPDIYCMNTPDKNYEMQTQFTNLINITLKAQVQPFNKQEKQKNRRSYDLFTCKVYTLFITDFCIARYLKDHV